MTELRFDGQVAIITGGGRGLGRAYALLLAARGAAIVVNDVGASLKGEAAGEDPAADVVREIAAAGGRAIACTDTVATPQGGQAIVDAAIAAFGRVDILIHSAGNVRRAPLHEMSSDDFESVLDVHLRGAFHVARPAYALMRAQGYGRVVLTASINGLYGKSDGANYATSKAGLIGLSHTIGIEGAEHGVRSNVIVPAAVTRMSDGIDTSAFPPMDPDMVAPAVAWLAHERCTLSGEILVAMGGRVGRAWLVESPGVFRKDWTIEDVEADIAAIRAGGEAVEFPPVPNGQLDHLLYGFAMARENGAG